MPVLRQKSRAYQTIGLLAIGSKALGYLSGLEANVVNETPGPQRIIACILIRESTAATEWGIVQSAICASLIVADVC